MRTDKRTGRAGHEPPMRAIVLSKKYTWPGPLGVRQAGFMHRFRCLDFGIGVLVMGGVWGNFEDGMSYR